VGSLENAAAVISRLHKGEKRLAFVDSRSRAEQLGALLRQHNVTTFVSHSSLSEDQRNQAEQAFASGENCVIVATSALELGIDVGDLDRVIQIDCPPKVSSFLQRMGRSGRRLGRTRNCLFLATSDASLIQAAGLIDLWAHGFVEPITAPAEPYHIIAQQLMALALQEKGIGRRDWAGWIKNVVAFAGLTAVDVEHLIEYMLNNQILSEDQDILWMGSKGEEAYGRRHFMELLSVFMSPPLFLVLHGREELGFLDEITFLSRVEGHRTILLGGRAWQVNHIDWQRRIAYVEATAMEGKSRWQGEAQALGYELCQSMKAVLVEDSERELWSRRTRERLAELRAKFEWLEENGSVVLTTANGTITWWTFGGIKANAMLASEFGNVQRDNLSLSFSSKLVPREIESRITELRVGDVKEMRPPIEEDSICGLKFSECLPSELAVRLLQNRLSDPQGIRSVLKAPVKFARELP
jgi:ATP-dependent Lhr-like helicase